MVYKSPPKPPLTCSSRTEPGEAAPHVSQGRGSLGEHGYEAKGQPLSTLSPGQVTLEARVRYTQVTDTICGGVDGIVFVAGGHEGGAVAYGC